MSVRVLRHGSISGSEARERRRHTGAAGRGERRGGLALRRADGMTVRMMTWRSGNFARRRVRDAPRDEGIGMCVCVCVCVSRCVCRGACTDGDDIGVRVCVHVCVRLESSMRVEGVGELAQRGRDTVAHSVNAHSTYIIRVIPIRGIIMAAPAARRGGSEELLFSRRAHGDTTAKTASSSCSRLTTTTLE